MNSLDQTDSPTGVQRLLEPPEYAQQLACLNAQLIAEWQRLQRRIEQNLGIKHTLNPKPLTQATTSIPPVLSYPPLNQLVTRFGLSDAERSLLLLCLMLEIDNAARLWWQKLPNKQHPTRPTRQALLAGLLGIEPTGLQNGQAEQNLENTSPSKLKPSPNKHLLPIKQPVPGSPVFKWQLLQTHYLADGTELIQLSYWSRAWLGLIIKPGQHTPDCFYPLSVSMAPALKPLRDKLVSHWQKIMQGKLPYPSVALIETSRDERTSIATLAAMAATAYKVPAFKLQLSALFGTSVAELAQVRRVVVRELMAFQGVCWLDLAPLNTLAVDNPCRIQLLDWMTKLLTGMPASFILSHEKGQQCALSVPTLVLRFSAKAPDPILE